jgi:hypothetical protein
MSIKLMDVITCLSSVYATPFISLVNASPDQICACNNLDLYIHRGHHKEEIGGMEGKGVGGYCGWKIVKS